MPLTDIHRQNSRDACWCVLDRDRAWFAVFAILRSRNRSMKKEAKSECEVLLVRLTILHVCCVSESYNWPAVWNSCLAQCLATDRQSDKCLSEKFGSKEGENWERGKEKRGGCNISRNWARHADKRTWRFMARVPDKRSLMQYSW